MTNNQKKMRHHSKFKNTGILFELLTRQITADIIAGKEISEAKNLLFKYFKKNSELGKENILYTFLLNENIKDEPHAERFLSVVLKQREKLDNKKLAEEKYNLIKEVKSYYPIDEFLKSNIKNYKMLASIYKIFENAVSPEDKFDVNEVYQAKNFIVESIVNKPKLNNNDDIISVYERQNEEIRLLAYKFLIENLNKKYSTLDEDQKEILREYINSVTNTNSLSKYVVGKVDNIKTKLLEVCGQINDSDVIKIKINEVVKQLDKVKPGKIVKDGQIMVLLMSCELLKELKKVVV